jgi:membrane protease YdiL (CAAX protease family)
VSAGAHVGVAGAARLLVGLRLRRLLNQVQATWQFMRRQPASGQKRAATPGKAKLGWLLAGLIGVSMVFTVGNLSWQALSNMQRALGSVEVAGESATTRPAQKPGSQVRRVPLPPAAGNTLPAGVLQGVALELFILLAAAFLLSLGSGDLAKPDWDIEWLVTLPVSLATLLAVRIAERTLLSAALLLLWPFLTIVAWEAGYSFAAAVPLGLLAALPMLAFTATLRTIVDTGLRLSVSPGTLRNLQAVTGLVAVLFLYLGMSPGTSASSYVMDWAPGLPGWAFWLPPGLATVALTATDKGAAGLSFLALALQAVLFAAAGLMVMMRQLRYGVVASGARESGRRPGAKPRPAAAPEKRALLTPVQARELRLLSRDRNFLVQSLVLPVLVIGAQFWFSTGGDLYASVLGTPQGLATVAFSMAAYALMFSAFQTLNTEGNALWILYSVPHPIEQVLRQKAVLWGIVCLLYPLAVFGFALASGRGAYEEMLGLAPIVLAGVPIFAVIATALGVFACDPLAQLVQRRLRPSYTYLYMLLASLYAYAIFASTVWQRASLMVLSALLGLALWQKARDHLPYLLDPSASPPARVSLSDGLIAAMLFFVVQGIVTVIFALNDHKVTGRALLIAFTIAGATSFLLMRLAFWRVKSEGVPATFGTGYRQALVWGAGGGAAAALAAFAYLRLAQHTPLLEGARESVLVGVEDELWIAVLAVAAAPIFEEFIFRGLIFGGLRRTLGLAVSVLASAAIFALVHPPVAVIPLFGLGVAAALVYERTRLLIGPIAVHAVYNAAVVGWQ